jgi:hypothetical protein
MSMGSEYLEDELIKYAGIEKVITWKDVFNTTTINSPWYGHIDKAQKSADLAGYAFFSFNGQVRSTDNLDIICDIEDL